MHAHGFSHFPGQCAELGQGGLVWAGPGCAGLGSLPSPFSFGKGEVVIMAMVPLSGRPLFIFFVWKGITFLFWIGRGGDNGLGEGS